MSAERLLVIRSKCRPGSWPIRNCRIPLPINEPHNERQHETREHACDNWKIEAEIVTLNNDIARQPPKPQLAKIRPEQSNRCEQQADGNEPLLHAHDFALPGVRESIATKIYVHLPVY